MKKLYFIWLIVVQYKYRIKEILTKVIVAKTQMVKDLVDIVDNMVNMTKAYSTKNVGYRTKRVGTSIPIIER